MELLTAAKEIYDRVRPLLAHKHPAIQGCALAKLTATWIAGHPVETHDALLKLHTDTIKELVALCAAEQSDREKGN